MQPVIYDVAVSADGFICGADGDVSAFPHTGPMVDAYLERLQTYSAVLMGANTYRFGLNQGLPSGANPYPGTKAVVFSGHLTVPVTSEVELCTQDPVARTRKLKREAPGQIYLCGGGALAGTLLRAGLIDRLSLKRAPVLLGAGVRLFGDDTAPVSLRLIEQTPYPDGTLHQLFAVNAALAENPSSA